MTRWRPRVVRFIRYRYAPQGRTADWKTARVIEMRTDHHPKPIRQYGVARAEALWTILTRPRKEAAE